MDDILNQYSTVSHEDVSTWYDAGGMESFTSDAGACIKYKSAQIAIFHFERIGKWYACQNLCPHKMEMVLSRGMIGDAAGIAKVACPMHKHNFSLEDGSCLTGDLPSIATFPVKIENARVLVGFNF